MDSLGKVAQGCALAVMLAGLAVLAAWALEIEGLKSVLPGFATMKANTALCFTLSGAALALGGQPRLRLVLAGAVLALGGLTLLQDLTGADFGIDQALFRDAPGGSQTVAPGRMSPATGVGFILSAAALLLLGGRTPARRAAEALALVSGSAGAIALLGYAYGVEQIYRLPGFTSVALHTAAAFVVLAAGILCARPDGIAAVFASPGLGGRLARRLLPLALLVPAVFGWLVILGEDAGMYGPAQGAALFASAMILALVALIWRTAVSLEASDADRTRGRQALEESGARLTGIVQSAMDAVITVDAGQRIVLFNAAAERMFGCPGAEALGSSIDRFIPARFREAHARHITNFAQTGETSRVMGRLGSLAGLRGDGGEFPIEASISQIDVAGRKLYTVIIRDITERLRAERTLRESEERLRLFIEHAPAALAMFDREMRYIHASRRWMSDHGLGGRDLCGLSYYEVFPETPDRWREIHHRGLSGEVVRAEDDRFERADGSLQWLRWEVRPWHDALGTVAGLLIFTEDITASRMSEDLIRSVALFPEENPHPVMRAAGDGTLLFGNAASAALLHQWRCAVGDRVPEPVRHVAIRALETGERQELETRCGARDLSFVLVPIADRRYVNLYGRDVTDRKQAEAALRDYADRLQVLSRRLIEIQETERRAIARELHDEIGQVLTAIKINLQSAERRQHRGIAAPDLKDSVEMVEDAIQRVRNRSLDLRPTLLDDLGLLPTIRWYLERHASQAGFTAQIAAEPLVPRPPPEVETSCFRVVQEAVTNAMRHARAKNLRIKMKQRAGRLELSIRDDGVGFDVKAARRRALEGGSIGLLGMEERVELLGGDFSIDSAPGKGTLIRVTLPVPHDGTVTPDHGVGGGEPG